MINMVSVVNFVVSHIATCFLDGPDGFLGFEGEELLVLLVLLELLVPLLSEEVEALVPLLDLFPDFLTFLLALDIQLASESVSDSRFTPKEGLCNNTNITKFRLKIMI